MPLPGFWPEALCCPDDRSPLHAGSGGVVCSGCGHRFPMEEGVLRLLPRTAALPAAVREAVAAERTRRDLEADRYDRLSGLRLLSLFELPFTLSVLEAAAPRRVLEVGCGTGRFTRPLARRDRQIVAVDHSFASLQVLRRKLSPGEAGRVLLVQGDAARLPLRDGWAEAALAAQVIEHLPSSALRETAVEELARAMHHGGRAVVSVYRHQPFLAREGRHSGAIYYRRFTRADVQRLVQPVFRLERLSGRLLYVWLAVLEQASPRREI